MSLSTSYYFNTFFQSFKVLPKFTKTTILKHDTIKKTAAAQHNDNTEKTIKSDEYITKMTKLSYNTLLHLKEENNNARIIDNTHKLLTYIIIEELYRQKIKAFGISHSIYW